MGTHLLWPLVPILLDLHLTGLISSITATISSFDATISKLNQSATEGEDVTFLCNGSITETAVQVTWQKDNVPLFTSLIGNKTVYYPSDRMYVIDESHLNISDVEQSDSGIYSCRVTNDIKGEQTTEWTLTIIQRTNSSESEQSAQRLIIILSCGVIGGLVVLVGLSCCVWFYRRQKKQATLSHRETSGQESPAPPVNRRRQRSQYFERLNSVYAEY